MKCKVKQEYQGTPSRYPIAVYVEAVRDSSKSIFAYLLHIYIEGNWVRTVLYPGEKLGVTHGA